MLGWFLRRQIGAFEKTWAYDASYMRDILRADPIALWAFSRVRGMSRYRKGVPPAPHGAAGITAVMAEDCGPCTQLAIDMAERAGVEPGVLRAVVAKDFSAMPEDVALAVRFTEATLERAPDANALREHILRKWGERGLVSLAFAMTSARLFPTLKYALGHGQACLRVTVGGASQPVRRELNQAA